MDFETEHLNSLPIFTGNDENYSVVEYFSKFETVAKQFNWNSDKKFLFVKLRLEGEAKNRAASFKDYDSLKNALIQQFYKQCNSVARKKGQEFINLAQPPNMPIKQFIAKVEALSFAVINKKVAKESLTEENFIELRSKLEKDILLTKMRPQILKRVLRRLPQTLVIKNQIKFLKQIKQFAIQEEEMLNAIGTTDIPASQENVTEGTIESLNFKIRELDNQVNNLTDKVNYLQRLLNCPPEKLKKHLKLTTT